MTATQRAWTIASVLLVGPICALAGTADDARYGERILAFDATRPHDAEWLPFVEALSHNATIHAVFDEADGAGLDASSPRTRSRFNGAVALIVADGLQRLDDTDVVEVQPLVRRLLSAGGCRDDSGKVVVPGKIMIDDQTAGRAGVFTRAVVAVNEARPLVPIDPASFMEAGRRSADLLSADEKALLNTAFTADPASVPTCAFAAAFNKLRFEGQTSDLPIMTRSAIRDVVRRQADVARSYRVGDQPRYPPEAIRANVTGKQRVRFTVDVDGHLKTVRFLVSEFAPERVTLANDTVVDSRTLFDDEIRVYIAGTAAKYPLRTKDGRLADTTFEIPFDWQIK